MGWMNCGGSFKACKHLDGFSKLQHMHAIIERTNGIAHPTSIRAHWTRANCCHATDWPKRFSYCHLYEVGAGLRTDMACWYVSHENWGPGRFLCEMLCIERTPVVTSALQLFEASLPALITCTLSLISFYISLWTLVCCRHGRVVMNALPFELWSMQV